MNNPDIEAAIGEIFGQTEPDQFDGFGGQGQMGGQGQFGGQGGQFGGQGGQFGGQGGQFGGQGGQFGQQGGQFGGQGGQFGGQGGQFGGQGGQFGQQGGQFGQQGGQFGQQGGQGGQGGQLGGQGGQGGRQPVTTTDAPTTTTQTPAVRRCIANCQVTSEYNPVCGSNRIMYQNRNYLNCARSCGVGKSVFYYLSSCTVQCYKSYSLNSSFHENVSRSQYNNSYFPISSFSNNRISYSTIFTSSFK